LSGSLREFSLDEWLQALGLSRKYLGLEVRDAGAVVGTVFVKSGNVVHAEAEGTRGLEACFRLRKRSDGEVDVFSNDTPDSMPEPLGSIDDLLREGQAQTGVAATESQSSGGPSEASAAPPPFPSLASPAPPPADLSQLGEEPPVTSAAEVEAFGNAHGPLGATPSPTPSPGATRASTRPAAPATGRPITNAPPRRPSLPAPTAAASAVGSAPPPPRRTLPPPANYSHVQKAKAALSGRILAISSPKGGCGKTTIALNLSLSLARQGRSVILVDGDINGDVLSSINARQRAEIGVFDVLLGVASSEEALLDTILPHFKILPAVGGQLPRADLLAADHSAAWQALLFELARRADVVVVDTPAGMYGVTYSVLQASTHVVGILQAEAIANRSFPRFLGAIRAVPDELRPEVLGIVVNMLQTKHAASLSVFQNACSDLPGDWLFDTSIPRHRAFLDATQAGLPLRQLDEQSPPAVAWLFDNLAGEVAERLRLGTVEKKPQPLLV
jgi:chromosome partitioning protein